MLFLARQYRLSESVTPPSHPKYGDPLPDDGHQYLACLTTHRPETDPSDCRVDGSNWGCLCRCCPSCASILLSKQALGIPAGRQGAYHWGGLAHSPEVAGVRRQHALAGATQ